MKKIVWTYGLLSGAIVVSMFLITTLIGKEFMFSKNGVVLGYTSMILASSLIFFGIRTYRQNFGQGAISFGKAFQVGILIALVSAMCYVISWMLLYNFVYPDFMTNYAQFYIDKKKAAGVSGADLEKAISEMEMYKEMYKSQWMIAGLTFMEIFPVGLIVTLVCSLILKKKSKA